MKVCIHNNSDCAGRIEWEHALIYNNKRIQEKFAIVPCCTYHHRGAGLDKDFNRYIALSRATDKDLEKYPKRAWTARLEYLKSKYENKDN